MGSLNNKNILVSFALIIICLGTGGFTFSQYTNKTYFSSNRGGGEQKDLSIGLYNALRYNDFDLLHGLLPGDAEINEIKKLKNERVYLNVKDSEELRGKVRNNFKRIIETAIDQSMNWSTIELVDEKFEDGKVLNVIQLELEDARSKRLTITIESVRINGKWFILDGYPEK
ncbi:MAG: hypothetical protein ACK4ND_12445 [Cytophagaceae bacterium]